MTITLFSDFAHFLLEKIYSKLYYVMLQKNLGPQFISSKPTKEKLQVLIMYNLEKYLI